MLSTDEAGLQNAIEESGLICKKTVGVSMNPFIVQGRDTVIVVKNKDRLKKYDGALFKRANGTFALHRVMKILNDGYIIIGDNCFKGEYVGEKQILGILDGYYKGENKYVDCNSRAYKFKIRLWYFFPVRYAGMFFLRVGYVFKRFFKKIFGKKKKQS